MKIKAKVMAAALMGLIPFVIGLVVITGISASSNKSSASDLITEYAYGVATGLQAFFTEAQDAANVAAGLYGSAPLEWDEGAGDFFEIILDAFPSINKLALVTSDGFIYETGGAGNPWQGGLRTVNDSDPNADPISAAGRDYFRELVANNIGAEPLVTVSEPYIPQGLPYRCIVTSAAVIHEDRAAGAINALQTLSELSELYSDLLDDFESNFGSDARMYLVSDEGQLVSLLEYNEARGLYEDILAERNEIVLASSLGLEMNSAFSEARRAFIDAYYSESESADYYTASARVEGTSFLVAAWAVEEAPFTVYIAVPQAYVLTASRNIIVSGTVTLLVVVIVMAIGMALVTRAMLSSIAAMDSVMLEIAEGGGDLTRRLDDAGNDEIASVCKNFNRFMGTLGGMVSSVSASADDMSAVGQTLSSNASEISGKVSTIGKDIDELSFSIEEQSASVTETSASITQIAHTIESITGQIESQSAAVTQSSAAVQEMVANIGTISQSLSKGSGSFDELKGNADAGKSSITAVQELVTKLSAQSDSLLEANSVIDNIASQTNLLAMNAAIEAAHAGESGKGFAVVAEEIRKLAEDSSAQSRTIAAGLKSTIESIRNIARATSVADGAFDSVAAKIDAVTGLVSEINLAMLEQTSGSRQVLEALQDIENVTVQIRDGAVEMNTGAETILKEITRLSGVSQSVQDRSVSIAKAAEAISAAVEEIVRNTGSNKDAIDVLVGITGKFKL